MKVRPKTSTQRMRLLRLRRRAAGEVERTVSAHPDDWLKIRELERKCRAARAESAAFRKIRLGDYPELRLIAWQRDPDELVDPREALALYEANWRHLQPENMDEAERKLLKRLADRHGAGVLNV